MNKNKDVCIVVIVVKHCHIKEILSIYIKRVRV